MKYPNIAAALGLDAKELENVNGYHLQNEEATVIDAHLGNMTTNLAEAETKLLNLTAERDTLQTANSDLTSTNASQAVKIAEMQAEITRLGSLPSGTGTVITTKEDQSVVEEKVPSYLDPNSPINAYADKQMRFRKK